MQSATVRKHVSSILNSSRYPGDPLASGGEFTQLGCSKYVLHTFGETCIFMYFLDHLHPRGSSAYVFDDLRYVLGAPGEKCDDACQGETKPRNPSHSDTFEGGRNTPEAPFGEQDDADATVR